MAKFTYDYKTTVFGHTIFVNSSGELDVLDKRNEILLTDRFTGVHQKTNLHDIVKLIQIAFPKKEEQKQLMREMFQRTTEQ